MYLYYPLIVGILETIEEWNEKLNAFAGKYMDNVLSGTLIIGVLIFAGFAGISIFNKK